jgi:hypothetical protein
MLERLADCAKDGAYFGASGLTILEQASAPGDGGVDIAALTQEPSMSQKLGLISRENQSARDPYGQPLE